jgi:hypothetical protein
MNGLTDGIDLDDGLASAGSGAALEDWFARHGNFRTGDYVEDVSLNRRGKIIGFTEREAKVEFATGKTCSVPTRWLLHVEPAPSVEAATSGEAKTK